MRRSCGVSWARRSSSADGVPQALQDPAGDHRVEQRLARGDPLHGAQELGAADLLEHVAGGAGHDRLEQRLVVAVGGQHQTVGTDPAAHLAAHLDPVAVGHPDIENGDIGPHGRDTGDGLGGVRRFTDDLDLTGRLEQCSDALAHDLVVVHEKGADHVRHPCSRPPDGVDATRDLGP